MTDEKRSPGDAYTFFAFQALQTDFAHRLTRALSAREGEILQLPEQQKGIAKTRAPFIELEGSEAADTWHHMVAVFAVDSERRVFLHDGSEDD